MVRLNITLPEDIARRLRSKPNKSQFIAEVLRERFEQEERERLKRLLIEGYRQRAREVEEIEKDWGPIEVEDWD